MITLILLAALGQQCQVIDGRQVCSPSRQQVVSSPWQQVAVRIEAPDAVNARVTGWGSGVIVSSDSRRALVLTNRHVIRGARLVRVHRLGRVYAASVVRVSPDADLAALEIASTGQTRILPIAQSQPSRAWSFGFGTTGEFHSHAGGYRSAYTSGDLVYGFVPHDGDSGSAVITPDGELAGLVWGGDEATSAAVVSLPKLRGFLAHETCMRFFRRQPTQINVDVNVPQSVAPAPIPVPPPDPTPAPVPVTPSPVVPDAPISSVAVGPMGPQGPPGPAGPPGAPASSTPVVFPDIVMSVKQPNGTLGTPKTFTVQTDPKTGKQAYGVVLDLNPPPTTSTKP